MTYLIPHSIEPKSVLPLATHLSLQSFAVQLGDPFRKQESNVHRQQILAEELAASDSAKLSHFLRALLLGNVVVTLATI